MRKVKYQSQDWENYIFMLQKYVNCPSPSCYLSADCFWFPLFWFIRTTGEICQIINNPYYLFSIFWNVALQPVLKIVLPTWAVRPPPRPLYSNLPRIQLSHHAVFLIQQPLPAESLYSQVQRIHGVSDGHVSAGAAVIFQVAWTKPRRTAQLQSETHQRGEIIEERVEPGEAQAETICVEGG